MKKCQVVISEFAIFDNDISFGYYLGHRINKKTAVIHVASTQSTTSQHFGIGEPLPIHASRGSVKHGHWKFNALKLHALWFDCNLCFSGSVGSNCLKTEQISNLVT